MAQFEAMKEKDTKDCCWESCAALLLGLPADKAIQRILASLGRTHRADRAWMIRYNSGFTHFWNTHEWTRGKASRHVAELQGVPVEMGAWLHETLLKNEHVHIADTRKMPRRAKGLQSEFLRQGIRSLLSVPVFYKGKMMFQIGYDTTVKKETWTEEEVDLLRRVGRLFALRLLVDCAPVLLDVEDETVGSSFVRLKVDGSHHKAEIADISHINAQGDYSQFSFRDGRDLSDSRSLRYWESALSPRSFVRVSRSVIVNLNWIETLDRRGGAWKLHLQGRGGPIPVGRSYRTALMHKIDA